MEQQIEDYGMVNWNGIQIFTIIGEIEGHDCLSSGSKTTKYEHILPLLAKAETDTSVKGMLFLMNTIGGDVSCGLALAEMIASLSKPTVSLVLGDSHSIGVPLAVATDYSFITPTATMIIHPVRMNGLVLGTPQTFFQFQQIQNRILQFISRHTGIREEKLDEMMMNTSMLPKDLGTVLVGEEAVRQGLVNEVGGIWQSFQKLQKLCQK